MRRKALDYIVENANVTGLDPVKEEASGDEGTQQEQSEA